MFAGSLQILGQMHRDLYIEWFIVELNYIIQSELYSFNFTPVDLSPTNILYINYIRETQIIILCICTWI